MPFSHESADNTQDWDRPTDAPRECPDCGCEVAADGACDCPPLCVECQQRICAISCSHHPNFYEPDDGGCYR